MLAARALVSYFVPLVERALSNKPLPLAWQHILFWGGLRGSLSVAVALSIPAAIEGRDQIQILTFGVVLFSLVVQGLTMRPLLKVLGMVQPPAEQAEYEYARGRLLVARAALDTLRQMERQGLVSASAYEELSRKYDSQSEDLTSQIANLQAEAGFLAQEELAVTDRKCLLAARSTLQDLLQQGAISDEVFRRLVSDIDTELQRIG